MFITLGELGHGRNIPVMKPYIATKECSECRELASSTVFYAAFHLSQVKSVDGKRQCHQMYKVLPINLPQLASTLQILLQTSRLSEPLLRKLFPARFRIEILVPVRVKL